MWKKHAQHLLKRKQGWQGAGRNPKLDEGFELSARTLGSCHQDAKHFKSLLSMVKKQFMSERVAHESWQVFLAPRCQVLTPSLNPTVDQPTHPRTRTTAPSYRVWARRCVLGCRGSISCRWGRASSSCQQGGHSSCQQGGHSSSCQQAGWAFQQLPKGKGFRQLPMGGRAVEQCCKS